MEFTTILWIYIVLLIAGGVAGFLKAKSKISLFTSLGFAVLLALGALGYFPKMVVDILLWLLVIVFGIRFYKTKKFMPAGFLVVLTGVVIVLGFILT